MEVENYPDWWSHTHKHKYGMYFSCVHISCWVNEKWTRMHRTTEVRYRGEIFLGRGNKTVMDGWRWWTSKIKQGGRGKRGQEIFVVVVVPSLWDIVLPGILVKMAVRIFLYLECIISGSSDFRVTIMKASPIQMCFLFYVTPVSLFVAK